MPSRYDLYGYASTGLDAALPEVEAALRHPLTEGESSFYAGRYYRCRLGTGREARLYRNHDPVSGRPVRSEFAAYEVLLEISDLPDMEAIERRLTVGRGEPVLLRSRVLDDAGDVPDDESDDEQA